MTLVGMIVAFKCVAHTSLSFRTFRVDAERVGVLDSMTLKKATEDVWWEVFLCILEEFYTECDTVNFPWRLMGAELL